MRATILPSLHRLLPHLDDITKHNVTNRAMGVLFAITIGLLVILMVIGVIDTYR